MSGKISGHATDFWPKIGGQTGFTAPITSQIHQKKLKNVVEKTNQVCERLPAVEALNLLEFVASEHPFGQVRHRQRPGESGHPLHIDLCLQQPVFLHRWLRGGPEFAHEREQ
jgi:hypothetical protein